MEEKDFLALMAEQDTSLAVLKTNAYTKQFGVVLSEEDAKLLAKERVDILRKEQRVEFKGGILPKLIFAFCDSPYIYQDNYVDTIGRLQEIFYLYKNESLDEVTDDELIEYMVREFHETCGGSLDYLQDTVLDKFAREIREGNMDFIGAKRGRMDEI